MQPLLFVGKEGQSAQESVEPQRMVADARLKLVLRQKRGGKYGKLIQQEHIETNKISCSFYKHLQTIDTNEERISFLSKMSPKFGLSKKAATGKEGLLVTLSSG